METILQMKALFVIFIIFLSIMLIELIRNLNGSTAVLQSYVNQKKGYSLNIQNSEPTLSCTYTQKIPLKLIQTSWSKTVDLALYQCVQSNRHMNPEYEYLFFDDKDCIDFIQEHFPSYLQWYNKLRPGAYKADLFRLLALQKLGGVYLDIKTTCLQPLRNTIPSTIEFLSMRDAPKNCVYNGVLASVPNHPIINEAIARFIDNIKHEKYGINSLDIGGPQLLGRVVNNYFGQNELDEIPRGERKGAIIIGHWRMMKGLSDVMFISDDEQTPLFNRACGSYISTKINQALRGKEYQSLWLFRKVYI